MIEAKELLGSFDGSLREYAARKLTRQGIKLRKVGGWRDGCGGRACFGAGAIGGRLQQLLLARPSTPQPLNPPPKNPSRASCVRLRRAA
jgi:hypothetical protein